MSIKALDKTSKNNKVLLFSVSKDDKFSFDVNTVPDNVEIQFIPNNTKPLTTVYNEVLHRVRENDAEYEYVIFMHSDVLLDLNQLLNHLKTCNDKYDLIGLCGASELNTSMSPLNWWTGSKLNPKSRWGIVNHGQLGNQRSFFNVNYPSITDHEAACIDGLCIIFTKTAINSELYFDENFQFNQYDTDLCLQAILKYNLKIGVLVEENLYHYSVGLGILNEDFLNGEAILRKKWNLDIPENKV